MADDPIAVAPDTTGTVQLPEITVRPEGVTPEPSTVVAGTGHEAEQFGPPVPDVIAKSTAARLAGHDWPDINGYVANKTVEAAAQGYTQAEVDQHLGYPPPQVLTGNFKSMMTDHAEEAQDTSLPGVTGGVITPTDNPEKPVNVGPLPEAARLAYSDAISSGATKGPNDFATSFTATAMDTSGDTKAPAAAPEIAAQLPNPQDVTDYAIAIAHQQGDPSLPTTLDVKKNIFDMWASTGADPRQIYQLTNADPLLADAITKPAPASEPATPKLKLGEYQPPIVLTAKDFETAMKEDKDKIGAGPMTSPEQVVQWAHDNLGVKAAGDATAAASLALRGEYPEGLDRAGAAAWWGAQMLAGAGPVGEAAPIAKGVAKAVKPSLEEVAKTFKAVMDDTSGSLGSTRNDGGSHVPSIDVGGTPVKATVDELEMALRRLRGTAIADRVLAQKAVAALPEQWRTSAFQTKVSHETETRMTKTPAVTPRTQEFLDAVRSWTSRQLELYKENLILRAGPNLSKKGEKALQAKIDAAKSVSDGHVHRIVQGMPERGANIHDPNATISNPITGTGARSLSQKASSLQKRSQEYYVYENQADGTRTFVNSPLEDDNLKFGQVVDDHQGNKYTIKPATMKEIEEGTKNNPQPIKYHTNFMANLIEDVLRLSRVNQNLKFLRDHAADLEKRGLFTPDSTKLPGTAGANGGPSMVVDRFNAPNQWMARIDVPQMQGWAHPSIAYPINDMFDPTIGDIESRLGKINRVLMASLFISPVVHVLNVGAHAAVGAGWDWIKPQGYGMNLRAAAQAFNEVKNLGPRYLEHVKEGAGLPYASTKTENFYTTMMQQLFNEQLRDTRTWGQYAKEFGPIGDIVKAELGWSRRSLWFLNDVMALQRQFVNEAKGMTTRDAIAAGEKDIPSYHVNSEVAGSRLLSRFLTSPAYSNFGRYRKGQIAAITNIVRDIVKNENPGDRMAAIGKATVAAAIALTGIPLIATHGPYSLARAGYNLFTDPQRNWASALSSLISIGPTWDIADKIRTNRDFFGRKLIDFSSKAAFTKSTLAAALGQVYPGQLAMELMKPGGVNHVIGMLLGAPHGVGASRGPFVAKSFGGPTNPTTSTSSSTGGPTYSRRTQ